MDTKWSSNHEKSFAYYIASLISLIVFAYQAQAEEEEWIIDRFKDLSFKVSGEVIHGDV